MAIKIDNNDIHRAQSALKMIWYGLRKMALELRQIEKTIADEILEKSPKTEKLISSTAEGFSANPKISFYFLSYSVLASNFINLIQSCNRKASWGLANICVELRNMQTYRNKVAAHFAYYYPHGDNEVTIKNSLTASSPSWQCDRYAVGLWKLSSVIYDKDTGKCQEHSTPDWGWALTSAHKELKKLIIKDKELNFLLALRVKVDTPDSFSATEIEDFISFVKASGEVASAKLDELVPEAYRIGFLYESDTLIAVAGLKSPRKNYRIKIQDKANEDLPENEFPYELGWVHVQKDEAGLKHAQRLIYALIESTKNDGASIGLYATSRSENTAMHAVLKKFGFSKSGKPYSSQNGKHQLELFLRRATTNSD